MGKAGSYVLLNSSTYRRTQPQWMQRSINNYTHTRRPEKPVWIKTHNIIFKITMIHSLGPFSNYNVIEKNTMNIYFTLTKWLRFQKTKIDQQTRAYDQRLILNVSKVGWWLYSNTCRLYILSILLSPFFATLH